MPKKPKFDHPVRLVRDALELTQPKFAKVLGISESYLQKIELGRKTISDDLANLIMARFGIHATSLKSKDSIPKPLLWARGGTLKDRIKEWEDQIKILNGEVQETFREHMAIKMDVLFEAASAQNKGVALGASLDRWMAQVEEELNLKATIQRILKERNSKGADLEWIPYLAIDTKRDGTIECRFASNSKSSLASLEGKQIF